MYKLLASVFRFLCRVFFRLKVVGRENIPEGGPLLVVFNHTAALDVVLLAVLPFEIVGFGAYAHRSNIFLRIGKALGHLIFVRRGEVDRGALRSAQAVLDSGRVLLISPEGTRTDGTLKKAKPGAAYLASRAGGVPLLPVGILRCNRALGELLRLRRPEITIIVGEVFTLDFPSDSPVKMVMLREATHTQIMPRIAELLPKWMRGDYA